MAEAPLDAATLHHRAFRAARSVLDAALRDVRSAAVTEARSSGTSTGNGAGAASLPPDELFPAPGGARGALPLPLPDAAAFARCTRSHDLELALNAAPAAGLLSFSAVTSAAERSAWARAHLLPRRGWLALAGAGAAVVLTALRAPVDPRC
jgi:hypothetical protein